ncbi:hypothetical protein [Microbacterium tenebrionis]|uniref:hypothetical protein n=1 Tax=Microbacterium tenebrionis TaxID=2830665 RepID=UPI00158CF962|nr:hypothetical protein [Microbacterium ihumii]
MRDIEGQFSEAERAILRSRSRVQTSHFAQAIRRDGKANGAAQSGPDRDFNRCSFGAVGDAEKDRTSTNRLSDLHDGGKPLERLTTGEDERGLVVVRQIGECVNDLGVHRNGNASMSELSETPAEDIHAAPV